MIVHAVVAGDDDRAVARLQRRRRQVDGLRFQVLQFVIAPVGHVVVIHDLGAVPREQAHHVQGGRLAHVVDVGLVGNPHHQHARPVDRLAAAVEGLGHARTTYSGIAPLICPASSMKRASKPASSGLPREVERVDRDAVPAQPGARIEGHEAERLGGRRVDDLPHVDVHLVAHERDLVHQPDVHAAERVLEQLHRLRHLGRAHRHDRVRALGVERGRPASVQRGVTPPDDLGDVLAW